MSNEILSVSEGIAELGEGNDFLSHAGKHVTEDMCMAVDNARDAYTTAVGDSMLTLTERERADGRDGVITLPPVSMGGTYTLEASITEDAELLLHTDVSQSDALKDILTRAEDLRKSL